MYQLTTLICLCFLGISNGLPNPGFLKVDYELLQQNGQATDGMLEVPLEESLKETYIEETRYDPLRMNVYHLFTRENPTVSQPLIMNIPSLLLKTNYQNNRRTIVLIHDWRESATADFNAVLIPAFLAVEDVNIIVVDWSAGADSLNYRTVIANTIASGQSVADFINWVNQETHSSPVMYHIVGFGYGGHQAGIVGRNVAGDIAYITALDPANVGWPAHPDRFDARDGLYTEVIHTNVGINGFLGDIGQVDFYPNGGISMPGCNSNACDHARSYFYFAESLASGGFTGRQCLNYFAAVTSTCNLLPGRLQMGGLRPKIGSLGVFLLETNAGPPFSME